MDFVGSRARALVLAFVVGFVLAAFGCSGTDGPGVAPPEVDGSALPETGASGSDGAADAGEQPDAGQGDAPAVVDAGDAGVDSSEPTDAMDQDSQTDATTDAASEGATDAAVDAPVDAPTDAASDAADASTVKIETSVDVLSIEQGTVIPITATVTGAVDTSVDWTVTEALGGTYANGNYTAPFKAGTFHLIATSHADPLQYATVTITVADVAIAFDSAPTPIVEQGANATFSAVVTGTVNKGVTYNVTSGCGTVDPVTGMYDAPNQMHAGCVLTATSASDNTKKVTVNFAIPAVAITLAPATAAVAPNQSTGFVATVTGSVNKGVIYSVDGGGVGGTINALGVYYAPGSTGSDIVRAISKAEPAKSATSVVTVTTTIGVTVIPATTTLGYGQKQGFAASVTGNANGAVTWSVVGGAGNGSITPTGVYTAPNTNGTYTVIATSVADGSTTGSATVTVNNTLQVAVAVAPASVSLGPGATQAFTATVTGTLNLNVTWSVLEPGGGTIDATGHYTAPVGAGTVHVVATSVADSTKAGIATVDITTGPPVSVSVSPTNPTLPTGGTQTFDATVTGTANTAVTWSASCGSIDSVGHYTAPGAPATCDITATSVVDSTKSATASAKVTNTIGVVVGPTPATVANGSTQQFFATITGTANTTVAWSVLGASGTGSIDSSGVYSTVGASATPPYTVTVKAVSQADGATAATATVNVIQSSVHSVSGTIAYSGSAKGRIYIDVLRKDNGDLLGGTSIDAPGPYKVRCLRNASEYTILAWRDVQGILSPRYPIDPNGNGGFMFDGTNDVTGVNVTLADPTPTIPVAAPKIIGVIHQTDRAAVVLYDTVRDANQNDIADHYVIYTSTTPNPGPQNTIATRIITALDDTALISPLVNGTAYYFAVAAVNSAGEGPRATVGPYTVGPAAGGNTLSGTIDLAGIVPTGPLYVYVQAGEGNNTTFYLTQISSPSQSANFTIPGVPNGVVRFGASLDQGADGVLSPLDPQTRFSGAITVSGNTTMPTLSFTNADADVRVGTDHSVDDVGTSRYKLDFYAAAGRRMPYTATLMSGPHVGTNAPWDIGVILNHGEASTLGLEDFDITPSVPLVGDAYAIAVGFGNSATTFMPAVTGVLAVPTNVVPGTVGVGTTPGFSWTAPVPAPSFPVYSLSVYASPFNGGNALWELQDIYQVPANPIVYNFDGRATPLTAGVQAQWFLYVRDDKENRASIERTFTP
jgi:hypothetical protein